MITINGMDVEVMMAAVEALADRDEKHEAVMSGVIGEANRRIDKANAHIQELGDMIDDDNEVIDVLLGDVIELTEEVQELKKENANLHAALDIVIKGSTLGMSIPEIIMALVEEASATQPAGFAKHFEKAEPSCCEQGFCGTDKCGGCCHEESEDVITEDSKEAVVAFPGPDGKLLIAYKVTRG